MSEKEIREAIAQQEEYLRRIRSCGGVLYRSHRFETYRPKDAQGTIPAERLWRACIVCGVTETDEDYRKKNDNRHD